jgi:hypothetical protein
MRIDPFQFRDEEKETVKVGLQCHLSANVLDRLADAEEHEFMREC